MAKFAQGLWDLRLLKRARTLLFCGFLIERVVLGTLAQRGTLWAEEDFPEGALKVEKFNGPVPQAGTDRKKPSLYIPTIYNYKPSIRFWKQGQI